jgi:ribose 5-phosphate isomerase B
MRLAIGSDHAGYRYKVAIRKFLQGDGHEISDFGATSERATDYPPVVRAVAGAVVRREAERGIVLGGSGNGEAMAANRLKGIRCALCWSIESARLARAHNDANMLSLGERLLPLATALAIVRVWLQTPFDGGRHLKRIRQLDELF